MKSQQIGRWARRLAAFVTAAIVTPSSVTADGLGFTEQVYPAGRLRFSRAQAAWSLVPSLAAQVLTSESS
jgi:hypothetical protein